MTRAESSRLPKIDPDPEIAQNAFMCGRYTLRKLPSAEGLDAHLFIFRQADRQLPPRINSIAYERPYVLRRGPCNAASGRARFF